MPNQNIVNKTLADILGRHQMASKRILRRLRLGYCGGYVPVWLVAKWFKRHIKKNDAIEIHDTTWFWSTLRQIKKLRDKKKISKDDLQLCKVFFSYIKSFQEPYQTVTHETTGSAGQGDLDVIFEDTEAHHLTKTYSLSSLLDRQQLIYILRKIIFEDELVLVDSHDHAVGIYRVNDKYYLYDPNKRADKKYESVEALADALLKAYSFKPNSPSPFSFRIFSFTSERHQYPAQEDILGKIKPKKRVDKAYADGETSLHRAAFSGCFESVKYHVAHGGVNSTDMSGNTPLHIAASFGRYEVVDYLLDHGACLIKNKRDETPLILTAEDGHTHIVKRLIDAGASVNDANRDGETALILAANNGYLHTVEALYEANADLDAADRAGKTALIHAAQQGHFDIAKYLIKHHAAVDKTDQNDYTALFYAVKGGYTRMTRLLLVQQADVDHSGHRGTTALMVAAQQGHLEMLKLLIKFKANIHCRDDKGRTAIDYAVHAGHVEIADWLRKQGVRHGRKQTGHHMAFHTLADTTFTPSSSSASSSASASKSSSSYQGDYLLFGKRVNNQSPVTRPSSRYDRSH